MTVLEQTYFERMPRALEEIVNVLEKQNEMCKNVLAISGNLLKLSAITLQAQLDGEEVDEQILVDNIKLVSETFIDLSK